MAALLGFEKSTTSEAITVSRREIIITEQINKFFDAPTNLPSVSTFTLGPQKQGLRVGSGAVSRGLIFVSKLFATYDTVVM